MTYPDFRRLLLAAGDTPDLTAYISDEGGSVPAADLDLLPIIHQMGHGDLTIRSIAQACGLSVRRLGHELGISYTTTSKWSDGSRSPSPWQLPLIAYAALSMVEDQGERRFIATIEAMSDTCRIPVLTLRDAVTGALHYSQAYISAHHGRIHRLDAEHMAYLEAIADKYNASIVYAIADQNIVIGSDGLLMQ